MIVSGSSRGPNVPRDSGEPCLSQGDLSIESFWTEKEMGWCGIQREVNCSLLDPIHAHAEWLNIGQESTSFLERLEGISSSSLPSDVQVLAKHTRYAGICAHLLLT